VTSALPPRLATAAALQTLALQAIALQALALQAIVLQVFALQVLALQDIPDTPLLPVRLLPTQRLVQERPRRHGRGLAPGPDLQHRSLLRSVLRLALLVGQPQR